MVPLRMTLLKILTVSFLVIFIKASALRINEVSGK